MLYEKIQLFRKVPMTLYCLYLSRVRWCWGGGGSARTTSVRKGQVCPVLGSACSSSSSRSTVGHGWAPQSGCWHLCGNVLKRKQNAAWWTEEKEYEKQTPRSVKNEGKEVIPCSSWKTTTERLVFSCRLWRGPHL